MLRLITGIAMVLLVPVSACAGLGTLAPGPVDTPVKAGPGSSEATFTQAASAFSGTAPAAPTATPFTIVQSPFPWEGQGLFGSIAFLSYDFNALAPVPYIVHLRLSDGHVVIDWRPPDNAWLANMALSPDGSKLVIAYAPPPTDGSPQPGYTGLYVLPGSCLSQGCPDAEPQPLLAQQGVDSSITPVWSPDGKYVYFVHIATPPGADGAEFDLERLPAAGGPPEKLISKAIWPRLSPDGSKLAYVAYDPPNGVNDLYLAAPDGTQATALLPRGTFVSVDAPIFTPDGSSIYFSATGVGPQGSAAGGKAVSWWERLTGVVIAEANGAPSEWWRMPVAGGQPTRLTQIATAGLSGGFSPDGQWMAFISYRGVGLYGLSSQKVTWLVPVTTLGDVIWRAGE
jgi:Tol biopolymer transport system component